LPILTANIACRYWPRTDSGEQLAGATLDFFAFFTATPESTRIFAEIDLQQGRCAVGGGCRKGEAQFPIADHSQ
jgi:hypothetical protein